MLPSAPILQDAIEPALALLPATMTSNQAIVLMLAIGVQESGFATRAQADDGPAHGWWQFEKTGGVRGVLKNPHSTGAAAALCSACNVAPTEADVYDALLNDDILAAGFARLLLWCDPAPLPALGDSAAAWSYYLRTWTPGMARPSAWPGNYINAVQLWRGH